ncbi:MAG: hypothetical protein ACK5LJ_01285, partial [Paracoccus sp. (in: a-proteobacteria)]
RKLGYLGPGRLRADGLAFSTLISKGETQRQAHVALRQMISEWLVDHEEHLLSEENILGTTRHRQVFGEGSVLYPNAVARLNRLLAFMGNPEVELFLAVRDPAEFVTSAYGQQLRSGSGMDIDRYVRGIRVRDLSWARLAHELLSCRGVIRLVCWRYEDYARLRPRLLAEMLGPECAAIVPEAGWSNSGISAEAYTAFVDMALTDLETPIPELLRAACLAHPKAHGKPGMRPLRRRVYAASQIAYERDLAVLARFDRVSLLTPEARSDEDTG